MEVENWIINTVNSMNLSFTKGVDKLFKIHDTWQWEKWNQMDWQPFLIILISVVTIALGAWRSTCISLKDKIEQKEAIYVSRRKAFIMPAYHGILMVVLFMMTRTSFTILSKISSSSESWFSFITPWNIFLLITSRSIFFSLFRPIIKSMVTKFGEQCRTTDENTQEKDSSLNNLVDKLTHCVSISMCAWYIYRMDWLANNFLGVCICITLISCVLFEEASSIIIALSLMAGADVFWVFFTDVMEDLGNKFVGVMIQIPYKNSYFGLGLGDIAIPGCFLALLLRFDKRNEGFPVYFWSGMLGYCNGLFLSYLVSYCALISLPALLFLVPLSLIFPLFVALLLGEFEELMRFSDVFVYIEEEFCEDICDNKKSRMKN